MLVADPADATSREHREAATAWNKAHAYSPENRYWTKGRAARAGSAWVVDPFWGRMLHFHVIRVPVVW